MFSLFMFDVLWEFERDLDLKSIRHAKSTRAAIAGGVNAQ